MPTAPPIFQPPGYRSTEMRRQDYVKSKRAYDRHWRRLRLEFLAMHPLCECDVHIGKDLTALADVVDHRVAIAKAPDLRLEWSNLRAMTKACHDAHTARTQGFAVPNTHR